MIFRCNGSLTRRQSSTNVYSKINGPNFFTFPLQVNPNIQTKWYGGSPFPGLAWVLSVWVCKHATRRWKPPLWLLCCHGMPTVVWKKYLLSGEKWTCKCTVTGKHDQMYHPISPSQLPLHSINAKLFPNLSFFFIPPPSNTPTLRNILTILFVLHYEIQGKSWTLYNLILLISSQFQFLFFY